METPNYPDPRMHELPAPTKVNNKTVPGWHSVALFFNLPARQQPKGYLHTDDSAVEDWLFLNKGQGVETLSEFVASYWSALSGEQYACGVETPRYDDGKPVIPTIDIGKDFTPDNWEEIIKLHLNTSAERAWDASGRQEIEGKRWIPSVVLVQRYPAHATAPFREFPYEVNGKMYLIGDRTHMAYDYDLFDLNGNPIKPDTHRDYWATLCHEYAHNFLEMWDLYGPSGAVGYWDMFGDGCVPDKMSEISSLFKIQARWLEFKDIIEGPTSTEKSYSLKPFTTSMEAIKIVPDPVFTPWEFFICEYRKSTGTESWRPDGCLQEEGLLILHVNTRFPSTHMPWLLREAPYMDPEVADFSDRGTSYRIYADDLNGVLFPISGNNSFTPSSQPNSNFYGGRPSGLHITDIGVHNNTLCFKIRLGGTQQVGWKTSAQDTYVAGRFTGDSLSMGQELVVYNPNAAALLIHRQAQWNVVTRQFHKLSETSLRSIRYVMAGDFDGDGLDELYVRTDERATILKWRQNRFYQIDDYLYLWPVNDSDREFALNLDGSDRKQILLLTGSRIIIWKYAGGQVEPITDNQDTIGQWDIQPDDQFLFGKFTQDQCDEVLLFNGSSIGLFEHDVSNDYLKERSILSGIIDGWSLGNEDKLTVGDFDGDGLDEIYIRSANYAGLLKWNLNRFTLLHIQQGYLEHRNGKEDHRVELTANDRSYTGKFRPDRDGILHRGTEPVGIVLWEPGDSMFKIQHMIKKDHQPFFEQRDGDTYVLGDFHRLGEDINKDLIAPATDFLADNLTDVFIANENETLMIGTNYVKFHPDKDVHDEFAVCWHREGNILFGYPGSSNKSVRAVREDRKGRNTYFFDEATGAYMTLEQFVNAIEMGLYPGYHIRTINRRKTPVSNPDSSTGDNLGP